MRAWRTAAIVGAGNFKDPHNARIIYLAVVGLFVLAVLLAVGTFVWWRQTKVEHPALGPLEVMGSKRWWKSDYTTRTMQLEGARPPVASGGDDVAAEPVDLEAVMTAEPDDFSDLVDPDTAVEDDTGSAEMPEAAELPGTD